MAGVFMKKQWLIFFTLCTSAHALVFANPKGGSLEESLALRRIAEYWKEGEYSTVKAQVKTFLAEYPNTAYSDPLNAMLGDLSFKEKKYADALTAYDLITGEEFQKKTQFNHLYCLYQQGIYHDVVPFANAFLKGGSGSKEQDNTARFQMADALFRLGKATEHPSARDELYTEALSHFKVLAQTNYAEQSIYPMAVIYARLKENGKAAALFETLAAKHPEQKEAFLFQAATLQLSVDKNAAIEIYGKIYPLKGAHASEAAFNQIQLLFEQKRYRDLLHAQEKAIPYISKEHLSLMRYYIGKSLFAVGDFQHAATHLQQFADSKVSDEKLLKSTYLSLVQCAKETHDLPLFDQTLKRLLDAFPKDEETSQALLLHARLHKEKGNFQRAQEDLRILIGLSPDHADRDAYLYDYALLFSESKQWAEGSKAFRQFISEFPKSHKKPSAYRHLLMCQIQEVKSAPAEMVRIKKQDLISTLVVTLGEKKIFSLDEKKQMRFLLGKIMFEIDHFEDALAELSDYVNDFPKDGNSANAYLMMAHCHLKQDFDPQLFTLHAEKALALNPNLPQQGQLHLQLYNAYLFLAKKADDEEKLTMINQAANHLFHALDQPVKKENKFWLANHYFHRFQNTSSEEKELYFTRATSVLEQLLGLKGNQFHLAISENTLEMEAEAIKLSQLYAKANRYSDIVALLSALNNQYDQHPDFAWKYQRLALFDLAQGYEQIGDAPHALETYDYLISSSSHAHSYFGTAARLQKTRLQFSQLSPREKQHKSGAMQPIYDQLKDLQIQRRLFSEPWHLEAALTYVDIKTSLAAEEDKVVLNLHLVGQVLDNFSADNDPLVKQYLAPAEQFPDKLAVYEQYMQFLSAEELRLEGVISQQEHDLNRAREFHEKAQSEYNALMQQPLNDLLKNRVKKRIEG